MSYVWSGITHESGCDVSQGKTCRCASIRAAQRQSQPIPTISTGQLRLMGAAPDLLAAAYAGLAYHAAVESGFGDQDALYTAWHRITRAAVLGATGREA